MARSDGSAREPRFDAALAVPGVRLHLYEKQKPRKGRKMGHLSAVGATPEEAVELVLKAKAFFNELARLKVKEKRGRLEPSLPRFIC